MRRSSKGRVIVSKEGDTFAAACAGVGVKSSRETTSRTTRYWTGMGVALMILMLGRFSPVMLVGRVLAMRCEGLILLFPKGWIQQSTNAVANGMGAGWGSHTETCDQDRDLVLGIVYLEIPRAHRGDLRCEMQLQGDERQTWQLSRKDVLYHDVSGPRVGVPRHSPIRPFRISDRSQSLQIF